ncbi:uncharacterized protein LOC111273689 isoform X2 [Varroa jacobsoni]|uniref:Uncharacterized protein n=1 Tax=Varroa destructor TaxID=109461 RepID=A0A7M7KWL2_VARDE|nr:uncharacterized protein LOC111254759 isoform X2 [Varroa destructor]XP_022711293.1 uncharacterized protein LOC111273689 isoform X2 [Varroa jacobsoni]
MATSSGATRTLSCRSRTSRSTSPVKGLLRRSRSMHQTRREQGENDTCLISGRRSLFSGSRIGSSGHLTMPRLLETPVRLITQSSLSLSLPKLYSRISSTASNNNEIPPVRERSISPPRPEAQLWRSRSVRRSMIRPVVSSVSRVRNVHFHVTSCTRCLSRGTIECYCNYVPRSESLRLSTDFFTFASSYPRLPEAHTSSRYTSASLSGSRRSPSMTSMSSLSQAYGGYYNRPSSSLPRPKSTSSVNRVGLLY